jgi:hypothetical protein
VFSVMLPGAGCSGVSLKILWTPEQYLTVLVFS